MKTGVVTSWERTCGWIKDDDDNNSYFCHYNNIIGEGFKTLEIGDVVQYEIGPGNRTGVQAVNITLIGGDYER